MRLRAMIVMVVAVVAVVAAGAASGRALGAERDTAVLAQEQGGGGDSGAETGAQSDSEGAAEEVGPPWTYQMARITIVLLVLLAGGIALTYHRLIVKRRRGEL